MAQVCDICGKGPQFGNNISHAHNVTKRRWNVNLQAVKALVNGSPSAFAFAQAASRAEKSPNIARLASRCPRSQLKQKASTQKPVHRGRAFVGSALCLAFCLRPQRFSLAKVSEAELMQ